MLCCSATGAACYLGHEVVGLSFLSHSPASLFRKRNPGALRCSAREPRAIWA